jgi:hypothetical protein
MSDAAKIVVSDAAAVINRLAYFQPSTGKNGQGAWDERD